MSEDQVKEAEEVNEQVEEQVEEDNDSDNDSDDDSDESVASEDSEPGSNEIIRTTGNFKIPVDENNLSPNTVIKLNLSNGDTIQTEYTYIQYFKEEKSIHIIYLLVSSSVNHTHTKKILLSRQNVAGCR